MASTSPQHPESLQLVSKAIGPLPLLNRLARSRLAGVGTCGRKAPTTIHSHDVRHGSFESLLSTWVGGCLSAPQIQDPFQIGRAHV